VTLEEVEELQEIESEVASASFLSTSIAKDASKTTPSVTKNIKIFPPINLMVLFFIFY